MNPGQPLQWKDVLPTGMAPDDAFAGLAAIAAFLVAWAIGSGFFERNKLAPRLKAIQERRSELKKAYTSRKHQKVGQTNTDFMRLVVSKIKVLKENETQSIVKKLVQAGYRSKDAIIIYAFCKLTLPFVLLGVGLLIAGIDWSAPFVADDSWKWLVVAGMGYAGARLPDVLVANQKQKRYQTIRKALADTLDLLLICAEAGLSLTAALDRVAKELGNAYPEMAEELSLTSVETGFLPERSMALKHLAERVDLAEVRSMVNVLLQTEKYGTPIAQALRVLSKEFRTQRMLRAEQKAARLPALLTVPLIVFILPTLFIVVLTPAILGVMDSFISK